MVTADGGGSGRYGGNGLASNEAKLAMPVLRYPKLKKSERFDALVEANQSPGKYLVDVKGLQDCQNLRQEAYVLYDNAEQESEAIDDQEPLETDDDETAKNGYNCDKDGNTICALDLKGQIRMLTDEHVYDVIYIPFDVNNYPSITDEMTDNRYNVYGCPYYPTYLSTTQDGVKIAQINSMTFKYPTSPLLSQPESTPEEAICSLESRSKQCVDTPLFCECIQIVQVAPKKNIEIIFIDQGFGGNISHTFHTHGYRASIVARGNFERPITKDEIARLDYDGKIERNLIDPPQKDTFVVPNKGYVVLRLFSDNLGYWLVEARGTAISPGTFGPGMQFLLQVGSRESFVPVPLDFPTCGNNKQPDMVFENN